jgi:hypothetical protein
MPFIAEASRNLTSARDVAFDRLADYASWPKWMPRSFRPVKAAGVLRAGDKLRVRVGGSPFATRLHVTVVDRPREITWCGGVRRVLWAEHRFLFETDGTGGARVRSVETWHGALAPIVRFILKPLAERIGEAQLAGLARALSS